MAVPTPVSGHTVKTDASSVTTRTINVPTHASGDMIVLAVVSDAATGTITSPSFSSYVYQDERINNATPTAQATATVMWKAAGGSEGSTYTIDTSVSERVAAICFAVNGADTAAIHAIAAVVTNATGTTVTIPAVTTSVADCLRISIAGSDGGVTTTGAATNHTLIDQQTTTSAGGVAVSYKTIATASTDPSETATLSASEQWGGFSFAIAPAASGTLYTQSAGGTLTSSGALTRTTKKTLAGTLTSAGALIRKTSKLVAGTLTTAGALSRKTAKRFTGTLTSSGEVATAILHIFYVAVGGTLTSSGDLVRKTKKTLTGTLTSAGSLASQRFGAIIAAVALTLSSRNVLTVTERVRSWTVAIRNALTLRERE